MVGFTVSASTLVSGKPHTGFLSKPMTMQAAQMSGESFACASDLQLTFPCARSSYLRARQAGSTFDRRAPCSAKKMEIKVMSNGEVTFVNILEVEDGKQAEVAKILQDATDTVISKRPGFVSVTLLASKDGKRIVNVARWASAADVQATQNDAAAAEFAKKLAGLAKPVPGLYDVVGEYSA
ncbi:antibiotic biosynthesis monooxygenase [Devosia sp. LC5]|uniref:antibiotic biosynthesis monooxygenase family protein n=1 Tax=Devosia sp. LC5 TaxID=1502724 RepID=UPI00190F7B98|nr:antibiotic biosynthesis monooxygenase [Devosia sp. LC5]